jgi:hypothetical protein
MSPLTLGNIVTSAGTARTVTDNSWWSKLLPHPRHYSMKTTPAFAALKEELTECVRAEVLAAQRQQR